MRDCQHGHQLGKCDTCDLIVAEKRIAELEHVLITEQCENLDMQDRIVALEKVAEAAENLVTGKDQSDRWVREALHAAGYLKEQGE